MRACLSAGGVLLEGDLLWDDKEAGWVVRDPETGEQHPLAPEIAGLSGGGVRITLFRLQSLLDLEQQLSAVRTTPEDQ
jgi:hypothetical protein